MTMVICLVILTTANLVMTIKVLRDINAIPASPPKRSLACEAIPIRFALDYPDCANALLYHMNVTNLKFLPRGSLSNRSVQDLKQ